MANIDSAVLLTVHEESFAPNYNQSVSPERPGIPFEGLNPNSLLEQNSMRHRRRIQQDLGPSFTQGEAYEWRIW